VSSDAAANAYPRWGAYGASKAALLHLSRIWYEELSLEAFAFSHSIQVIWTHHCTPLLYQMRTAQR
jgi:NAD(P)-dependent dehydrogenase (short-subunit alcohol dehydrogenase family)